MTVKELYDKLATLPAHYEVHVGLEDEGDSHAALQVDEIAGDGVVVISDGGEWRADDNDDEPNDSWDLYDDDED